eukprot:scaffold396548_cov35-Attheya_sp.AAC.1
MTARVCPPPRVRWRIRLPSVDKHSERSRVHSNQVCIKRFHGLGAMDGENTSGQERVTGHARLIPLL